MTRTRIVEAAFRVPRNSSAEVQYVASKDAAYTVQSIPLKQSITWGGNGRSRPHPCSAVKEERQDYPGSSQSALTETWRWNRRYKDEWKEQPHVIAAEETWPIPPGNPSVVKVGPSDDDIASRINDACVNLSSLPVQSMMNLPQAIIELKDIPRTIRAVPKLVNFLKSPIARKRGLTAMRSAKEIASAYLAYVFGVRPTVTDVNNFLGQVPPRVKAGVRSVRYTKGQPVRAGLSIVGEDYSDFTSSHATSTHAERRYFAREGYVAGETAQPLTAMGFNTSRIAAKGESETTAWPYWASRQVLSTEVRGCVFGRVASDFSQDFSLGDDISFNADLLSTGWELTPFSFVVDWFVDLGKWMRQANRLNAARSMGFHLEDGIWLSKRVETITYWPVLGWDVSMQGEIDGYYVRFRGSCSKSVDFAPISKDVTYDRNYLMAGTRFPRLNLKGLSAQGTFQWASGAALAIQACSRA